LKEVSDEKSNQVTAQTNDEHNKISGTPKQRKSYLPDWILESRAKLEASQEEHRQVERRLSNLQDQVQTLSLRCEESICSIGTPHSTFSSEPTEAYPPSLPSTEPSPTTPSPGRSKHLPAWFLESSRQLEASKEQTSITQRRLSNLSEQVTALGKTIARAKSSEGQRDDKPASQAAISKQEEALVVSYVQDFNIHTLPQRALVQVALYSEVADLLKYMVTCQAAGIRLSEDWIWEPLHRLMDLPLMRSNGCFQPQEAYTAVVDFVSQRHIALAFIRLITQAPKSKGKSMQEHSTFQRMSSQKDMRQVMLSGLQGLVYATANRWDTRTATLLREMDTVRSLMTLISSADSARVQELACCALANLLCKFPPENSSEEEKRGYEAALEKACSSVNAFDWKKILIGLLSSPNASLTVCHGSRLNGTYLSSTRCQGMASKHAARALLNWWSQPHQQILMGMEIYAEEDNTTAVAPSSSLQGLMFEKAGDVNVTPIAPGYHVGKSYKWIALYYYSSGGLKDESPLELTLDENGNIEASGSDNLGPFTLSGASDTMGGSETCWLLHKNYIDTAVRVSHIAYWCQGKGMWGVWEMKTGRSEFKLQKGGVFRFIPSSN